LRVNCHSMNQSLTNYFINYGLSYQFNKEFIAKAIVLLEINSKKKKQKTYIYLGKKETIYVVGLDIIFFKKKKKKKKDKQYIFYFFIFFF
jgi:hypothetical protein